MNTKTTLIIMALLTLAIDIPAAAPVGNAFTYQGKLMTAGNPTTGIYDMKFTLYDTNLTGVAVAGPVTNSAVGVTNGYFAVMLDFGASFNGNARWLEIEVRTNGAVSFSLLYPRQAITPAPYAVYAPNAGAAATATTASTATLATTATTATTANSVAAANITGTLSTGQLPAAVVTNNATVVNLTGWFTGNGAGLTGVNADQVDGQHGAFYQNAANVTSGTLADARLSANVPQLSSNQVFLASNRFAGVVTLTNTANVVVGTFSGNGAGLTALNAAQVTSGILPLAQVPTDVVTNYESAVTLGGAFSGNGAGLTNLNASQIASGTISPAILPTAVVTNNETGLTLGGIFSGNGAGLTNLNATNLTGTIADARLSTNVSLLTSNQVFSGSNRFAGVVTLTNAANTVAGSGAGLTALNASQITTGILPLAQLPTVVVTNNETGLTLSGAFSGNAAALTNLTAANLTGTVADARLSANVALLSSNQVFIASNRFAGVVTLTNVANTVAGSFAGNGGGLTNLNASQLSGGVSLAVLPTAVVTNSETGLTLGGTFSGNGAGLTNLNAATLSGTIADALLSTNIALLASNQVFTASNRFSGVVILTNTANTMAGAFAGNAGGLTNLIATNLTGGLTVQPNAAGAPNILAGAPRNYVGAGIVGATISGGGALNWGGHPYTNLVTASFGTIGGGYGNAVLGGESVIGGGSLNIAGDGDDVIGGGVQNTIGNGAFYTTIGGGAANTILQDSYASTIAGGWQLTIEPNCIGATMAGGSQNTIKANNAYSFIGGGVQVNLGTNSGYSAVPGGYYITILSNAAYSVVGGGSYNTAGGLNSMVVGGTANLAGGNYSLAAGNNARATNSGAFVWSDGTGTATRTTTNNQFVARASGGYVFYSSTGALTGVQVAPGGGSWTALSDRNAKENFAPVDAQSVLEKVAALPVSTWNYKSQDAAIRHIGPMAQDFKASFQVGETDMGLTSVDVDGVALAAIQGLNQKLEQKENELKELNARLLKLEERLKTQSGEAK